MASSRIAFGGNSNSPSLASSPLRRTKIARTLIAFIFLLLIVGGSLAIRIALFRHGFLQHQGGDTKHSAVAQSLNSYSNRQMQQRRHQQQPARGRSKQGSEIKNGSSDSKKLPPSILRDDLLQLVTVGADEVWLDLLREASNIMNSTANKQAGQVLTAMEVGMHNPRQCLRAAKLGLNVHCVEPSPTNFHRVQVQMNMKGTPDVLNRVTLHHVAAGPVSGEYVPFTESGSTGDHVGDGDVWTMTRGAAEKDNKAKLIQVPTMKMDDIIIDTIGGEGVFVLKIDTQGFEPAVFSGLERTIREHRAKYILTEYWPRGIDFVSNTDDQCIAVKILQSLVDAGYTLYALPVMAHPRHPRAATRKSSLDTRPMDDLQKNCQWYYNLEKQFPSPDYKMGYWSDVLAVAPGASLPGVTAVGRALSSTSQTSQT